MSGVPDYCSVAFKEWDGVCQSLDSGRQGLILRKGGIEERPGGFRPEHSAFWLYPTYVHQAQQPLREPIPVAPPDDGAVAIRNLAVCTFVGHADRLDALAAIEDLHVWTPETIEKRFHYRTPGLWVLGVRIYRLATPFRLAITPEHLGCKTWVPLDAALSTAGSTPVLDDPAYNSIVDRLRRTLSPGAPG